MKSTIKERSLEIKYPCLMRSKKTGAVVLFIGKTNGTVVYENKNISSKQLGKYSKYFRDSTDTDVWELLDGQVILEND